MKASKTSKSLQEEIKRAKKIWGYDTKLALTEQNGTPMGMEYNSCCPATNNGNMDFPVTLDGQELTQNDIGKIFQLPNVGTSGVNDMFSYGTIVDVFPTSSGGGFNVTEITDCPPQVYDFVCGVETGGGTWFGCLPINTCQYQAVDGQQGWGGGGWVVDGIYTTQADCDANCSAPAGQVMGFVATRCNGFFNPGTYDHNITLDGQPVTQSDVGQTIMFLGNSHTIDSVMVASDQNSSPINATSIPVCPDPTYDYVCFEETGGGTWASCIPIDNEAQQFSVGDPGLGGNTVVAGVYSTQAECDNSNCGGTSTGVDGCTDSTATNYDPLATQDDGSCVYPPPVTCDKTCQEMMPSFKQKASSEPCTWLQARLQDNMSELQNVVSGSCDEKRLKCENTVLTVIIQNKGC